MRILITIFEINDYGGIVPGVENLMRGFQENGHKCNLVILRPGDRDTYVRKQEGPRASYKSVTGAEVNLYSGWYGVPVMTYGTQRRIDEWKLFANQFDYVIHELPNPKPEGCWQQIFDLEPPQVLVAHDAHFRDAYPYIVEIAHKVAGVSVTQPAGYEALSWFPAPRAFIGAAHIPADWSGQRPWVARKKRAVCAHVWKAWKHMDQVMRTAPYLSQCELAMGGDGIEARYMRSIDKCKPKYEGLWREYIGTGHTYHGTLSPAELFALYEDSMLMVDMSYSKKFAALGCHFNRSIVEAGNYGCVTLCTKENMAHSGKQVELFTGMQTHWQVPQDITPQSLAEYMDWIVHDSDPTLSELMVHNVRCILSDFFDYRVVCMEHINLANGKPAGVYPVLETGSWPTGRPIQAIRG
jgi:hypothetical protein